MSATDLFIVGTPTGQWHGGATAWLAADCTERGLQIGGGECAWLELESVAQRFPDAGWLVFVENPAVVLAAALAVHEIEDPAQWLSAWCVGARRVLRQVQRAEARCLLVDADEARRDHDRLVQACQQRFGASVKASIAPALTAFDSLSLALGQALVFADRGVQALYSELQASCALFDVDNAAAFELVAGLQIDAAAAAKRLRDLHLAEQQKIGELAAAHSAIDQHLKELKAAGEENELMLAELHQVQEELEHYYLECCRLEGAATTAASAVQIDLSIEQVQPVTERSTHPHRELTFTLQQVNVGDRTLPEARVRLVEHHGHPGLVVFANAQGAQLLTAWRQSGQEDGMPYMLLVPSDAGSQPVFDAMDSTDWLVTLALVLVLERRLTDPVLLLAPHWQPLARRLREQLQEMPRRFRYGSLAVSPVGEPGSGVLAFNFGQVHFGVRQLPQLTVHWRSLGPQAGLTLLCGPDGIPPLPSWPDDESGAVPDRLHLPLEDSLSKQERHLWRQRVTPADLDFVLALLAVWPEALLRVPPDLLGGEAQAQRLTQAAASLTNDARRGTPSQPWGGMLNWLTGPR